MEGFDATFTDPTDYILGITKEIWEDRGIATLHRYYTEDLAVRSPTGVVVGNQAVIAATLATLAEFPDRTLLGEDVIWSAADDGGFLSSHRILSTATHTGDGVYGPASGTRLRYRIIADCAAKENRIYDEWLIRDSGAIVRQMGFDPRDYAADQIEAEQEQGGTPSRPFTPADDQPARYTGTGNDEPAGERYADTLTSVMGGDLAAVETAYDRAVQAELPGGETGHGRGDVDRFWLGLRSAFPGARFEIHHRIGRHDPDQPPRAALRWSLHGTHDGWGPFGRPTGAEVHVMGLSHAEYGPRGIRREWVLIDETAVWKQILLQ
ncbi:MAG: ester cyclase [Actinomycetota bacterium]